MSWPWDGVITVVQYRIRPITKSCSVTRYPVLFRPGESLSFSLESLRILESGVQRCLDAGLVKGVSAVPSHRCYGARCTA